MRSLTRNLSLSNREEQILMLASRGMTDRQISGELGIRAGTINTHWSRIRLKLGAATRSEAVSILLKEKADVTQQVLEAEKQTLLDELVQQKETEAELRDSRKLLQTVLNNAPIILWSTDENGEFQTVEGKELATLGLKPNASLKQRVALLAEVVEPDAIAEALQGRESARLSERGGLWLETRISPMKGPRGNVTGLIGVSTDVTSRRVAEQALLEDRRLLSGILALSPTITHVEDLITEQPIYASESIESALGYTPQQVRAMGDEFASKVVHPDEVERFSAHLARLKCLNDGEVAEFIHRIQNSDGEWRWFLERTTVFRRTESGAVEWILTVAHDIHNLKNAEDAVRQNAEFLAGVLETSPSLTYVYDPSEDRVVYVSRSPERYLGLPEEEVVERKGLWLERLIDPKDVPAVRSAIAASAGDRNGSVQKVQYRIRKPDGDVLTVRDCLTVLNRGADGSVRLVLGVSSEVDE